VNASTRLVGHVDKKIGEFLTSREPILASIAPELTSFGEYSRYLLSGGKRFRAKFCFWGWEAARSAESRGTRTELGGAPIPWDDGGNTTEFDSLVSLASALELFHSAALVHDDIIDNSATRRGMPAAHIRFEALHSSGGWAGSGEAFGRASAILLGDLLLAWSDELVAGSLDTLESRVSAIATRTEFNRMRTDVTLGQYLDILEENAWPSVADADILSRANRVIVYKSAKYSVEAPLVLGALLGGATPEQVSSLREFGLPLGIAFQLRDDLLGVFGDETLTGKPSGDDLREGKRTVLIALARAEMDDQAKLGFDSLLGSSELTEAEIVGMQQQLLATGAVDQVEQLITDYTRTALEELAQAPLGEIAKLELRQMAVLLTERQA
jgi:geranylgeranyl diphosphate synthase type I